MRKKYQRQEHKSNHKFEVIGKQELLVRVPLPMAEVWAEMQARVEQLAGQAGLQILRAILENEVSHRVGPPHRPNPSASCVRWGNQPGYVVFAGQKVALERPRVRTREGGKWNWKATVSCSRTENYNERCEKVWWRGCPRGTIVERWKVWWKATGSRKVA